MALVDRSRFKSKPQKNIVNATIVETPSIKIISYFGIIRKDINEKFSSFKVISHVSGNTIIDELLKLNTEWVLKKMPKKHPESPLTFYELSACNNESKEKKSIDIRVDDEKRIATGGINYTDYKYYINMRKSRPELIVYQGRDFNLLEYLGFKDKSKRMADKKITMQLEELREKAIRLV